jgi:hypothetical protein
LSIKEIVVAVLFYEFPFPSPPSASPVLRLQLFSSSKAETSFSFAIGAQSSWPCMLVFFNAGLFSPFQASVVAIDQFESRFCTSM